MKARTPYGPGPGGVAGIPLVVWSVVRGIRGMNGNLD